MGEAPRVRVPRKNLGALKDRAENISRIFGARLALPDEAIPDSEVAVSQSRFTVLGGGRDEVLVPLEIFVEPVPGDGNGNGEDDGGGRGGGVPAPDVVSEIAARIQVSLYNNVKSFFFGASYTIVAISFFSIVDSFS